MTKEKYNPFNEEDDNIEITTEEELEEAKKQAGVISEMAHPFRLQDFLYQQKEKGIEDKKLIYEVMKKYWPWLIGNDEEKNKEIINKLGLEGAQWISLGAHNLKKIQEMKNAGITPDDASITINVALYDDEDNFDEHIAALVDSEDISVEEAVEYIKKKKKNGI